MTEQEGVIKYVLDFVEADPDMVDISALTAWRAVLMDLGMVGQDPERYQGLGFGNLSMRTPAGFLITGSQTGARQRLMIADHAEVTGWDLTDNRLAARGRTKPSSEALTHAAVYDARHDVDFVFHGHSPDIWNAAAELGIQITDASVPYGTPAMAVAVRDRLAGAADCGLLAMGGHEDGIVAWGREANDTGLAIVGTFAEALIRREAAGSRD